MSCNYATDWSLCKLPMSVDEFRHQCRTFPHAAEWKFEMRRQMQEIEHNVWLGPYGVAIKSNQAELESIGITHMIVIREQSEVHFIRECFPGTIVYLAITLPNQTTHSLIPHFRQAITFIEECVSSGGKVLVYGRHGMNLSASLVIAYIMHKHHYPPSQAYCHVLSKRFSLSLESFTIQQLLEFEPILRAELDHSPASCSNAKRSHLELI